MKKWIKHHLKKRFLYLYIKERFSPAVQIEQRKLVLYYQEQQKKGVLPNLQDTGFRVFSQFEEDGKLLFLFSLLGMTHPTFVEFGSDDGVNSNSANLYFHFGWKGLFIDGNARAIERGRAFFKKRPHPHFIPPTFIHDRITSENINELISKGGLKDEIGLLSIDLDGNDYWVWKAINVISPQVVIIETQIGFGLNDLIAPYDPNYVFPGKHPLYHGASVVAMNKLAQQKGYRLVGANQRGFNLIFLRKDLLQNEVEEIPVEALFDHPACQVDEKAFDEIRDFPFVSE
ncbi:MAG: hypothetical protein EP338_13025 [Bacteroidetes bacterium]|nr:MAG: hypothetical protein EP338_13025 [Bacteroidota bacterium]